MQAGYLRAAQDVHVAPIALVIGDGLVVRRKQVHVGVVHRRRTGANKRIAAAGLQGAPRCPANRRRDWAAPSGSDRAAGGRGALARQPADAGCEIFLARIGVSRAEAKPDQAGLRVIAVAWGYSGGA